MRYKRNNTLSIPGAGGLQLTYTLTYIVIKIMQI